MVVTTHTVGQRHFVTLCTAAHMLQEGPVGIWLLLCIVTSRWPAPVARSTVELVVAPDARRWWREAVAPSRWRHGPLRTCGWSRWCLSSSVTTGAVLRSRSSPPGRTVLSRPICLDDASSPTAPPELRAAAAAPARVLAGTAGDPTSAAPTTAAASCTASAAVTAGDWLPAAVEATTVPRRGRHGP